MARPTKEELEILEPIISAKGEPNLVIDIFKVRSGEWTQVRIWSYANLGTMRREDLFITDSRLQIIQNFYDTDNFEITEWDTDEFEKVKKLIDSLNESGEPKSIFNL